MKAIPCEVYDSWCYWCVKHKIPSILHGLLTVCAAVDVDPEPNPAAGVPFERNEFQKAGSNGLAELVIDRTVGIHVARQSLEGKRRRKTQADDIRSGCTS